MTLKSAFNSERGVTFEYMVQKGLRGTRSLDGGSYGGGTPGPSQSLLVIDFQSRVSSPQSGQHPFFDAL